MKITQLKIAPSLSFRDVSENNPLVCTVKLASDKATVETVLSQEDMHEMLRLVQRLVADAAERNIAEFVNTVTEIEGSQDNPPAIETSEAEQ